MTTEPEAPERPAPSAEPEAPDGGEPPESDAREDLARWPTARPPEWAEPLVDREAALAEISAAVGPDAPEGALVSIVGAAGVGKTRVAAEIARRVLDEGRPVAWVALGGVTNAVIAASAIAAALGVPERGADTAVADVVRELREAATGEGLDANDGQAPATLSGEPRFPVLVLDGVAELVPNVALVDDLRAGVPGLAILVTSRRPLRLEGETIVRLPPLALPARDAGADEVAASPAVRLLVSAAAATGAAHGPLAVTPANAGLLADVARRLDGLPLALEVGGAALQRLGPAQLLERLAARPASGGLGGSSADPVLVAVAGALDRNVELLSPAARVLYRRLAIFAGRFDAPLAAAVLDRGVLLGLSAPDGDLAAGLDELADASLLRRDEGYVMLETVRAHGRRELERAGELATAEWAHAHAIAEAVDALDARLVPVLDQAALGELDRLSYEAAAAFDRAAARNGNDVVLRLAAGLAEWYRARGRLTEGRLRVELALRRTVGRRDRLRARAAYGGALLAYRQGDFERADALLDESIALFGEAGDRTRKARAWNLRALVSFDEGRMADAADAAERGLEIRRATADDAETAASLNTLGGIRHYRGELGAARAALEEGLAIRERIGDESGVAVCLANLALVDRDEGALDRAADRLERAVETRRRLEDRLREATTVHNLGLVRLEQGRRDDARAAIEAALELARRHGDRVEVGEALSDLSLIARDDGRIADAWQLATEAVATAARIGARGVLALALEATAALSGGEDPADGARLWAAAGALRDRTGYRQLLADRRRLEAEIEEARSRADPDVWDRAWAEGSALDERAAAALALERGSEPASAQGSMGRDGR